MIDGPWRAVQVRPGEWQVTDGTTTLPEVWRGYFRAEFRANKLNLRDCPERISL